MEVTPPYWEYRCISVTYGSTDRVKIDGYEVYQQDKLERVVNGLGKEGWELVGLTGAVGNSVLIFKRPRQPTP